MKNTHTATKLPRGRPPGSTIDPDQKKKRVNITISDNQQKTAERIGGGNVSAGIGIALDLYEKIKGEVTN